MDNNIPELKRKIWLLVEAISSLTKQSKAKIVRELTTSFVHVNGRAFEDINVKWSLCQLRGKLDRKFVELGFNVYEWYRTGSIVRLPDPVTNQYIPQFFGEGTPPLMADGSYDTKRT